MTSAAVSIPGPWSRSPGVFAPRRRAVVGRPRALLPCPRAVRAAPAVVEGPAPAVVKVLAPAVVAVPDELVVAALPGRWLLVHVLARGGPLDESGLVLAAWRASPGLFGLAGHEWEHPDAGAVRVRLGGADGCMRRGWVRRGADGRLAATATARRKLGVVFEMTRARCERGLVTVTGQRSTMPAGRKAA